ncbi:hypothetical protein BH10PAT1_BH10PAT1_1560 [soil metagenome]
MAKKILIVLLLFCIPAAYFLLTPGFYEPQDLHHMADIYQMVRAIQSGQIVPRLGPDFMFGHGYPLFNFYYPLPFYIGAGFFFLIGSLTISFKLVFISIIILSVIGMYLFLREFLDKWASFVGAILFLYTPYRAVQIYVRGAIGEALALALLPFIAFGIVKLLKNPTLRNISITGLIGGIFILSHNYFWALAGLWLATLVFVPKFKNKIKGILFAVISGLIALGLSAYWWMPALIEQKLVATSTPFPLFDNFPFIKQLIIPSWGYGASFWGPNDGMSFQIGVVNLIVFAVLILFFIFKRKTLREKNIFNLTVWILVGMAVNLFLMNVRSYPIWKLIPFHDFVQFPWRLLCFTAFFTSVAAGVIVSVGKKYLFGILIIGFSILLTLNYFQPSKKFYKADDVYLNRFFANRSIEGETPGESAAYLQYSEDYLQLPTWTKERPKSLPENKIESINSKITNIKELNPVSWQANFESSGSATIVFHELYFPGWYSQVDGKDIQISPTGINGDITANLSDNGNHTIKFFWQETPLRKAGDLISVIALGICAALLIIKS